MATVEETQAELKGQFEQFSHRRGFYFGLTIEHWQFDMVCQKGCSVCAILSGIETRRTLRKTEVINFKTFIYNMLLKFLRKYKIVARGLQ